MLTEPELAALRLLVQQPKSAALIPQIVDALIAKGFVERRAGFFIVTSRGHAALLRQPEDASRSQS